MRGRMRKQAPILLTLAATLAGWLAAPRVHAQQPSPALLLSADRARAFLNARANQLDYIPGETIVKFRPGMAPADQTRALRALRPGTALNATAKWIGDAVLLDTPNDADSAAVAATLARQPEVEWAQPNYLRKRRARPNDPSYSLQWNMDVIGMPAAWDINQGASGVTIAIVDFGVTSTDTTLSFPLWTGSQFETVALPFRMNPDISAGRVKPGRDFVFLEGGPVLDMLGHGSFVAAVAAQETNNGVGAAGVAHQASLLPLKVCFGYWEIQIALASINEPGFVDPDAGGCPDEAIAEAIRFAADSGVQVINVSLGGDAPSPLLRDALTYAVSRGSFVAMPAGNAFEDGNPIEYPAAYAEQIAGAMTVGAVSRSSRRAAYSSTGSFVEIAAPGGDFADGGLNGMVTQFALNFFDFEPSIRRPRFDRYGLISSQGTSMAVPHVSGVAALLYSQGVTNPAAVEAIIRSSATDLGQTGRDNEFGFGLVDARAAVRGMGLVK
jgi:serine protease